MSRPGGGRRQWLDIAVVVAIEIYLLTYLEPGLVLSGHAATGGDTASHFPTLQHLIEAVRERRQLLGWMPGNLTGFPVFQPYFPLPFLLMAAAAPLLGAANAFNVGIAAAVLALPPAAYLALRLLGLPFPIPALGAVSTLPFLFLGHSAVWGGNLLSVLSGEFAYLHGLVWLLLYLGVSIRSVRQGGTVVWSALLLAAVGLSHGYPFLFAVATTATYVLLDVPPSRALGWIARLYALTFGLLAFWLLPALVYSSYGTPYRDIWPIDGWRAVLPPLLWPWAVAAAGLLGVAVYWVWRRRAPAAPPALWPLGLGVIVALLLYRVAWHLGLVDIRLLPFVQLLLVLLGAAAIGLLARRGRAVALVPVLALLATVAWVDGRDPRIRSWIRWNFSGFESKPGWPAFAALNRRLAGGVEDPRVAWEHSPLYRDIGTIRAFESLPRFSGRSTLEGLYGQSSPASPFIFYLQSELSLLSSCPFPDYHCARLDPQRAASHLRLFNASQVVVRTDRAREAYDRAPAFERRLSLPPFTVYRLRDPGGGYVEPLAAQPLLLRSPSLEAWKHDAYRWFKRSEWRDVVPVWAGSVPEAVQARFPVRAVQLPDRPPRRPLEAASVEATASLDGEEIVVRTSRPGHPLLLKVSYHPRWRADDGSPVLLAAPAFLLVLPEGEEVRLRFTTTGLGWAASLLSLAAGLLALTAIFPPLRRRLTRRAAGAPRSRRRSRLASWLDRRSAAVRWGLLGALLVGSVALFAGWHDPRARPRIDRAMQAYLDGDCAAAAPRFERIARRFPSSSQALEAVMHRARCAERAEDWATAATWYRRFTLDYPAHPYHAEAVEKLAVARERLRGAAAGPPDRPGRSPAASNSVLPAPG